MTKSTEDDSGDLATDLAALQQGVARLAETMRKLLQHQTQAAGHRVSEAVGDVKDKIANTGAGA